MPGRLHASFRFGNINEHLGLLLLKGISAVAEVPRPEDVGIDAVATLLRLDDDKCYYAEDMFLVQLKSKGRKKLTFANSQLKWLTSQDQPMFIGVISAKNSSIALYSTLHVNQAVITHLSTEVTILFDQATHNDADCFPWKGGEGDAAEVWLGTPILSWSIRDMTNKDWRLKAYTVLKRFLALARRELGLLRLGLCSKLIWTTNDPDSIRSETKMIVSPEGSLSDIAQQATSNLLALMGLAASMPEAESHFIMLPCLALIAAFKERGVNLGKESEINEFFLKLHMSRFADSHKMNPAHLRLVMSAKHEQLPDTK